MRAPHQPRLRIVQVRDAAETMLQQLACFWELGTTGLVCRWRPVLVPTHRLGRRRQLDR